MPVWQYWLFSTGSGFCFLFCKLMGTLVLRILRHVCDAKWFRELARLRKSSPLDFKSSDLCFFKAGQDVRSHVFGFCGPTFDISFFWGFFMLCWLPDESGVALDLLFLCGGKNWISGGAGVPMFLISLQLAQTQPVFPRGDWFTLVFKLGGACGLAKFRPVWVNP